MRLSNAARRAAAFVALALAARGAGAQHEHHQMAADTTPAFDIAAMRGPLGVPFSRMGSGTSWLPDATTMHANHKTLDHWFLMLHGVAFPQFDVQGTTHGDNQLGMVDWEMLMAMRKVGTGLLHLHAMASLEPATLGPTGYPLLLQTGESYKGQPLVDRQHPHDLFMELTAMFEQPVARDLAVSVYGGPAGEPALGPVAVMHRPSAQSDPLAPLGHHWQDATHITYGVVTGGVYSRKWKVEGSWFNGREPDENRWTIDLRTPDSYSARLTVAPSSRWALAGWYGYLKSPEALHAEESIHRYGASALFVGNGIGGGDWATSAIWGANAIAGAIENSALVETNLEIGEGDAVFGRAEYVRKSGEDLVVSGAPQGAQYDIASVVGGYLRQLTAFPGGTLGFGARVAVNFIPRSLEPTYGTRTPVGLALYFRVRPSRMKMSAMPGHDMPM